jgi:hypothetical protein
MDHLPNINTSIGASSCIKTADAFDIVFLFLVVVNALAIDAVSMELPFQSISSHTTVIYTNLIFGDC